MPGETSLLQLGLWVLMAMLALGLMYVAIVFRLQPVFLLPLAGGLLFANLPLPRLVLGWGRGLLPAQAGSPALIGGGDGLAATFLVAQIAPELTGPVSLAAFTLVGLYFLVEPYLVDLLTSTQERMLRMPPKIGRAS